MFKKLRRGEKITHTKKIMKMWETFERQVDLVMREPSLSLEAADIHTLLAYANLSA